MDIYTAQSGADRLDEFAEECPGKGKSVYKAGLDRYVKLAYTMASALEKLVMKEWLRDHVPDLVEKFKPQVPACSPPVLDLAEVPQSKKHSKEQVIACYDHLLEKMSEIPSSYIEVDRFKLLLARWFHARFVLTADSDFKCNTKLIGRWILLLAIGYGNALETGQGAEWLKPIDEFVDSLEGGFSTSRYILPFEIYKSIKDLTGEAVSLTGAVIWDMLYDLGLNSLDSTCSASYLPGTAAKELYDQRSDDAPYYYHNYKQSSRVLDRVKLTPKQEVASIVD